ncbi:MAG: hypothetical protein JOY52_11975 [Hyphomicrobiales bacterium]|jgi:hypothetical protein|nr:hypothetical protein [Hyphomicrobiales bacterium]
MMRARGRGATRAHGLFPSAMVTAFALVELSVMLVVRSRPSAAQDALFTSERDCTTDVEALCARVMPGGGRVLGCLHLHVSELSVGCSTILSKASWTAQECATDIREFCPHTTFGNISNCLRPHLSEASSTCKSALTFMGSPAAGRGK